MRLMVLVGGFLLLIVFLVLVVLPWKMNVFVNVVRNSRHTENLNLRSVGLKRHTHTPWDNEGWHWGMKAMVENVGTTVVLNVHWLLTLSAVCKQWEGLSLSAIAVFQKHALSVAQRWCLNLTCFFWTLYHITLVCLKWSQRHQIATFKQFKQYHFAAVELCCHFSLAVCLCLCVCIWIHWEIPACWKIRKLVKIQKGFGALRVANALNATNSPSRDMLSCIFSNPFEDTGPAKNKTKARQNKCFRVLNSDAANQIRHMRPWSQWKPCLGRRRHSILSSLGKSMMRQLIDSRDSRGQNCPQKRYNLRMEKIHIKSCIGDGTTCMWYTNFFCTYIHAYFSHIMLQQWVG